MNQGFFFEIRTLRIKDGKTLKALIPDNEGFYTVPLMVLGKPSRNNVRYDDQSVVDAISNPIGRFRKLLDEGSLEGEWGHPPANTDLNAYVQRTMEIYRPNVSHFFNGIWTDTTEQDTQLVWGKVKPFGPQGKYLAESFAEPNFNTAFSLRSLCSKPQMVNGIQNKKVVALVTFDAVGGPGFEEASKRYASNEDLVEIPVSTEELVGMSGFSDFIGVESIHDEQLFDILGSDQVTIHTEQHNLHVWPDLDKRQLITPSQSLSIFHTLHGRVS